ncbi:MAG: hypothetical protein QOI78_7890 [Actinomycetota bacterium]|nr:hypothetical protein [Actinomycetota bacterium]
MQLTEDVDDFLARAGDFLRSRPALHTTPLTTIEKVRLHGPDGTVFGWLEDALFYRRPSGRLTLTSLPPEQADTLAADWAELGRPLSGVLADHDTAAAFAEAWQRRTGAAAAPSLRVRLHRLGTLTPPEPVPEGRARVLGTPDRAEIIRWCTDFAATVGEALEPDAWAASRFGDKLYTFWETEGPVAMAASTTMVAGMIRVDPVSTPAHLRGRGYAGAVTVAVSRAALAAGATDVVLYTNPANATSNALYRRIGYVPIAEFTGYDFS